MPGFYVKDMNVPKNCDDCPISYHCEYDAHIDGYSMIGGRPRGCKIKQSIIPENIILDTMDFEIFADNVVAEVNKKHRIPKYVLYRTATRMIDAFGVQRCSRCNTIIYDPYPYCQNCGANVLVSSQEEDLNNDNAAYKA